MTETTLVRRLMMHASTLGGRWFREQVGRYRLALPDCQRCQCQGRVLSSGWCVGASDVLDWTPHVVTEADLGRTIAVMTAWECKVGRNVTTTEQGAFLSAVQQQGGIAAVVRQLADADVAVSAFRAR